MLASMMLLICGAESSGDIGSAWFSIKLDFAFTLLALDKVDFHKPIIERCYCQCKRLLLR